MYSKVRLKRSKERSDAMENLQRHTVSGLRHICDLLGAPEPEDDTHVAEMVSITLYDYSTLITTNRQTIEMKSRF